MKSSSNITLSKSLAWETLFSTKPTIIERCQFWIARKIVIEKSWFWIKISQIFLKYSGNYLSMQKKLESSYQLWHNQKKVESFELPQEPIKVMPIISTSALTSKLVDNAVQKISTPSPVELEQSLKTELNLPTTPPCVTAKFIEKEGVKIFDITEITTQNSIVNATKTNSDEQLNDQLIEKESIKSANDKGEEVPAAFTQNVEQLAPSKLEKTSLKIIRITNSSLLSPLTFVKKLCSLHWKKIALVTTIVVMTVLSIPSRSIEPQAEKPENFQPNSPATTPSSIESNKSSDPVKAPQWEASSESINHAETMCINTHIPKSLEELERETSLSFTSLPVSDRWNRLVAFNINGSVADSIKGCAKACDVVKWSSQPCKDFIKDHQNLIKDICKIPRNMFDFLTYHENIEYRTAEGSPLIKGINLAFSSSMPVYPRQAKQSFTQKELLHDCYKTGLGASAIAFYEDHDEISIDRERIKNYIEELTQI